MENASKALIIAGAILISILLISVGIIIMNSTGSVTDQVGSQADSMAIQTFNAQFTPYEGEGKSASQIRDLINVIRSSNASNANQVLINGSPAEYSSAASITNTRKYNIELYYSEGVVINIQISGIESPDTPVIGI